MRTLSAGEAWLFQGFLDTEAAHHWEAYADARRRDRGDWAWTAKCYARQCDVLADAFDRLVAEGEEEFLEWVAARRKYWANQRWPVPNPHGSRG